MKNREAPDERGLAAELTRLCDIFESVGREQSRGDDTARGIAVIAGTIRGVIERWKLHTYNATRGMGL